MQTRIACPPRRHSLARHDQPELAVWIGHRRIRDRRQVITRRVRMPIAAEVGTARPLGAERGKQRGRIEFEANGAIMRDVAHRLTTRHGLESPEQQPTRLVRMRSLGSSASIPHASTSSR